MAKAKRATRTDEADRKVERVSRFDLGKLGKLERTPSGGVRIPARVAKSGILEYVRGDGSIAREWLPPEEASKGLETLADAAVTIGHPADGRMVTPATFRRDAVGHVREPGRFVGGFVETSLAVEDAVAISRVDAGELVEISSGYACALEMRSGVTPDGERYDAIQRDREYNHVALLPIGGGRAGREVALRLDARAAYERTDRTDEKREPAMEHETIDGVTYKIGTPEWTQARKLAAQRRDAADAEVKSKLDAAEAAAADLRGKLDAAIAEVEKLKADMAAELSEEKMDARAESRLALLSTVRPILGEKFDGKADATLAAALSVPVGSRLSDETIRRAACAKLDGKAPAGLDGKPLVGDLLAVYFAGRIAAPASAAPAPSSQARADAILPTLAGPRAPAPFRGPNLADKWRSL